MEYTIKNAAHNKIVINFKALLVSSFKLQDLYPKFKVVKNTRARILVTSIEKVRVYALSVQCA